MQVYGNVATLPVRKESKSTGKGYFEMRLAEAQRGIDNAPTFYTVRVMRDEDQLLDKGDFVKVTGKLKADFYIGRDGKPSGTLLIIAFEASKIAKPAALAPAPATALKEKAPNKAPDLPKAEPKAKEPESVRVTERAPPQRAQDSVRISVEQEEADWSTLYS